MTDARLEEIRTRQRTINEMAPLMYLTEDRGGIPGLGVIQSNGETVAVVNLNHGDRHSKNTAFARWVADSPHIVAELLAEVNYLRGQLADLCIDSQAAAELTRLRGVLDRVYRLIEQIDDDYRGYAPDAVGELLELLDETLGGAPK